MKTSVKESKKWQFSLIDWRYLCVVMLMLCSYSVSSLAEIGARCPSRTSLPLNGDYSEAIDFRGDKDMYRITIPSDGMLTIFTTGSIDTFGQLRGANCAILQSNDNGDSNNNFSMTQSVTAGTYYILVRGYKPKTRGAYTLSSSFTANPTPVDNVGDSCSSATDLATNSSIDSSLDFTDDYDYFRIDLSTPSTLTVQTQSSIDTYGYLTDDDCNVIAENDDAQNSDFLIEQSVAAGTYYVAVLHNGDGTGDYSLSNTVVETPQDSDGDGVLDDVDSCPNTPTETSVDSKGCPVVTPTVTQTLAQLGSVNSVTTNEIDHILVAHYTDPLSIKTKGTGGECTHTYDTGLPNLASCKTSYDSCASKWYGPFGTWGCVPGTTTKCDTIKSCDTWSPLETWKQVMNCEWYIDAPVSSSMRIQVTQAQTAYNTFMASFVTKFKQEIQSAIQTALVESAVSAAVAAFPTAGTGAAPTFVTVFGYAVNIETAKAVLRVKEWIDINKPVIEAGVGLVNSAFPVLSTNNLRESCGWSDWQRI
jgi:hypothetical protein